MSTSVVSQKEYRTLLERQRTTDIEIARIKKIVLELARDEIKPAVAKQLEEQSRLLDQGQGKAFSSVRSFRAYLRGL